MYFLLSLVASITFTLLFLFVKTKGQWHFEYAALIFGGAAVAWMVECIKFAMEGDGFIRFDQLWIDLVISFWTLFFGFVIYFLALLIPKLIERHKKNEEIK